MTQGLQNHRCISAAIAKGAAVGEIRGAATRHLPSSHFDGFFLKASLSRTELCWSCRVGILRISIQGTALGGQSGLSVGRYLQNSLLVPWWLFLQRATAKLKNRRSLGSSWNFIHLTINSVWLLQEMTFHVVFLFLPALFFLQLVAKISFECLMLNTLPLFPWCRSSEYVTVVSVLLAQNFPTFSLFH